MVGASYSEDDIEEHRSTVIEGSLYYNYIIFPGGRILSYDQHTEATSFYGQVAYEFGEAFKLTTEARHTTEQKDYVGGAVDGPIDLVTGGAESDYDEDNVSWKVSLDYMPNENTLVYLSAGKGYKSGGFFGGFLTAPEQVDAYGPESNMGEVADSNSPHGQAVLDMGFVTVGQTNTLEIGMMASTESRANGPCKNPWNLEYSVMGSSGGAGAALASGMVSIAQGSDAGGSIRMPASANGVFGIKPSRGRDRGTDDSIITTTGPLSRSVRDSATYLYHLQEPNPVGMGKIPLIVGPSKRRLKVAMFTDYQQANGR